MEILDHTHNYEIKMKDRLISVLNEMMMKMMIITRLIMGLLPVRGCSV